MTGSMAQTSKHMTTSTESRLVQYERSLREWVRRKGKEGLGGTWSPTHREYTKQAEPTFDRVGCSDYEKSLATRIRERIINAPAEEKKAA